MSKKEKIEQLAKFASGIWKIHPFAEGNTRTTAVFIIKYLYTPGFETNNELFEKHSTYFRNALVRANYQNLNKNIYYTLEYLNKFFANLLFGEKNTLDSREMQIKDDLAAAAQKSSQKDSQKILEAAVENPRVTTSDLAAALGVSRRTVAKRIAVLKEKRLIRRIGADRGGYWEVLK